MKSARCRPHVLPGNSFASAVALAAVIAGLLLVGPAAGDISLEPPTGLGVRTTVSFTAQPFPLCDVRLLDGPFRQAVQRDGQYLLSLDPDRLLHAFRLNAGLPSSAKPLGGWEAPKAELRGHFVGHYLSACASSYAATGERRFRDRAALLVRELARCQNALGSSGYLSAFPLSFIDRVETTGRVWAPYYTLHKILAGLLDIHVLCDNPQALQVAKRFGVWLTARIGRLSDEQVEKMLAVEHGGINEAMANLYAATGDPRFLQAARRLFHKSVLEPLAAREDKLSGLHANTQFPKVIGTARLYELTGEERYHTIAEFFWDRVVHHHSYAIGGNSDHEHFGPPDKLSERVSPWTAETCNTYNMLKLTRHIFAWHAAAAAADYYERALYNQILPTQDPRTGRLGYHVPLYGAWFMPYNTPDDSFWCCTGTGVESQTKYGDSIYWHDADGLLVNLFIPSELTWRERGLTVRQQTHYPAEDSTRLELTCRQPQRMALRIRCPGWSDRGMSVAINGQPVKCDARPGSFVALNRVWQTGDRVEVRLPMSLHLEPMPDNPSRVAICYGPVVLAGELGTKGIEPPMPYAKKQGDFFNTKAPPAPALLAAGRPVNEWLEPVKGQPLTFRTRGVGRPGDVTLTAFYCLLPQRYSIYWDLLTETQWSQRQATLAAAERRERQLAARPVFHIKKSDILRDGKPVVLRGVNAMHIFGGNPSDLRKWPGIDIAREFVCNLKNAPLAPGTTYHDDSHKWTLHSLQALATGNSRRGIVTMFCPFNWDGNDARTGFCGAVPSKTAYYDEYKKRMRDWAKQFKGQPYVWIELWNEPYGRLKGQADDALWLSATSDMVDNLRLAGWDGIIALSGAAWGQDETVIERMGPQLLHSRADIIFDIHVYEQWLAHPETIPARVAALRAKELPFLIGEFGPANGKTCYDPKPIFDVARAMHLSALAWIYTAPNPGDKGADFLLTHDYLPNNVANFGWGSAFQAFLAEPH